MYSPYNHGPKFRVGIPHSSRRIIKPKLLYSCSILSTLSLQRSNRSIWLENYISIPICRIRKMNPLDKELYSSKEKKENETTLSRKRKSLIPGKEVTPNGKEEENEREVSQKQNALIQGQKVLSLILGEEVTANGKEENETMASRKRKTLILGGTVEKNASMVSREHFIVGEKVTLNSKKATETPKSYFASIIPENIMLIYLRRSSVQDLLKDPETFECNIVGSFVRIQSDPNDYSQINSHKLLQVAGVKKAQGCSEVEEEYILQVIKLPLIKDIPISLLSDEYFEKEECWDLSQRIKAGCAYGPTFMELQSKAQMLHKVITKQWLARELSLMQNLILQNLIDRNNENGWCATEKGWRKELFEYLKREAPLQKSAEQEKILLDVPNVITEDLKSDISCFPVVGFSTGVDEEGDTAFVKGANGVLGVTKVDKLDLTIGSITEGNHNTIEMNGSLEIARNPKESEVIDISSDEDDDNNEQQGDDPDLALWYYKDPKQVTRGPVQARCLKDWKEDAFRHG